jgi:hypothetical protein
LEELAIISYAARNVQTLPTLLTIFDISALAVLFDLANTRCHHSRYFSPNLAKFGVFSSGEFNHGPVITVDGYDPCALGTRNHSRRLWYNLPPVNQGIT